MRTITLDARDFLAGESNWDYLGDKGYSPDSYGLNLFLKPGVLNFGWTSQTTYAPTGNVIGSAYDKNNSGNDVYQMDDEGAFYTLSGSTYTKRQTDTNGGYALGTSDIVQFKLVTYATSASRLVRMTGSDLAALDSTWWVFDGTSGYRHPLEVVEDALYIGDRNVVYAWDGSTSSVACTLPTERQITSLRKHPDGRHLIAFTGYTNNYSHTNGGPGYIYVINKDTKTWEREIEIETQVEGSRNVSGVIYVTYGKKLGYFTGSGVKFLKQLKTSATTYSHCLGNMEDFLIVRDGTNALAYGDLGNGTKSWHNWYQASQTITNVVYKGNGIMLVSDGDGAGGTGNVNQLTYATATGGGRLVSNRYNFGQLVKVRRMEFTYDAKLTGSILNTSLSIRDTDDNTNLITISYPTGPTPNKSRVELDVTTDIFQFMVLPVNGAFTTKLIRIFYEPID